MPALRFELGLDARDLVAQEKPALLQATQREVVAGEIEERAVDEIVEVRMLHSQFDQLPRQGVQVVVHGRLGRATSSRFWTFGQDSNRL